MQCIHVNFPSLDNAGPGSMSLAPCTTPMAADELQMRLGVFFNLATSPLPSDDFLGCVTALYTGSESTFFVIDKGNWPDDQASK